MQDIVLFMQIWNASFEQFVVERNCEQLYKRTWPVGIVRARMLNHFHYNSIVLLLESSLRQRNPRLTMTSSSKEYAKSMYLLVRICSSFGLTERIVLYGYIWIVNHPIICLNRLFCPCLYCFRLFGGIWWSSICQYVRGLSTDRSTSVRFHLPANQLIRHGPTSWSGICHRQKDINVSCE